MKTLNQIEEETDKKQFVELLKEYIEWVEKDIHFYANKQYFTTPMKSYSKAYDEIMQSEEFKKEKSFANFLVYRETK